MKKRKVNIDIQSKKINENLLKFSKMNVTQILNYFSSNLNGLNEEIVKINLDKYGTNEISSAEETPWFIKLIKAFISPFNLILMVLGMISFITDIILAEPDDKSYRTVIVIALMILISSLLKFSQEYKSSKSASKLKAMVKTTTAVLRHGKEVCEIDIKELAVGDIVNLAAGDMIPADVRIIECKDLFVSQSTLTGESAPIEKFHKIENQDKTLSFSELDNICLFGTNVVSGSASAVVIATGDNTYFGLLSKTINETKKITSFEKGVNSVSSLLIKFMLVMVPIVFFINGFTKGDWLSALLFAISIAVGLTPEMLPMIVTAGLAKGAVTMAKHKTIVKKLDAIQNFGAMDILCTDKTGTLTIDEIIVERHLNIHGIEDLRILRHGYLNSYFQTGLRNLMDVAILSHGKENGFNSFENSYKKVDEIPFDFARRRMSVVLEDKEGKRQLITKGAVEEMISVCSLVEYNETISTITKKIKDELYQMVDTLNEQGMRVIAIAQKNEIPDENSFSISDECDMVLLGFIAFLDPPKESSKEAITALYKNGVDIKILTGDNDAVTRTICREVGIEVNTILLGTDIEKISDDELSNCVDDISVFAKLSPMQKSRIIKILQKNGHTVGFMGDGINDAPALKQADVGISVDTAVDIAKESADIILLEKSLMVLEEGVIEGRKVFGNIMKYIKITASSNFGNVFSVLVSSIFLPFLPMLPIHLLVQNLLYDVSQIAIPWDTMDDEYLSKPRKWNADDIGKFMKFIGPISSIFDIITFLVMWFVFKANTEATQSLFQSGWFTVGLLSQTLIVHMIRTRKIPFVQSWASLKVTMMTGVIIILGITIPFTNFGASIGLMPLPPSYFPWLIAILFSYCFLTQVIKNLYIKKFNLWL